MAPSGVISVLGGKITGYRAIAEEVTDKICRRLGAPDRKCATADTPLPGARGADQRRHDHLYDLYGARASEVRALAEAEPHLAGPLSSKYPDVGAQVIFAVRSEHCARLSDFLRRRTLLGATEDQGWDAAGAAARLMAMELGWSRSRIDEELAAYRADIARTLAFRDRS